MLRTPLDILNLFVASPGDMLFFLMVIAFSQGALFLAWSHRSRYPHEHTTRRYFITSAALLGVWLALMAAAALAQFTPLQANDFMPPLERLAYAVTLSLLGWAFLSGEFENWRARSNVMVLALALSLALLYLFTAAYWVEQGGGAFNATDYALVWTAAPLAIAAAGFLLALLNIEGIVDAPLKMLFFLAIALGNGLDLYYLTQGETSGSYLGGARLAYVAGLALYPLIIHRFSVALLENSLVEVVLASSQPSASLGQTPSDPATAAQDPLAGSASAWNFAAAPTDKDSQKLLNAIGAMLDRREGAPVPEQVVKAILAALDADVAALLNLQANNYADISAGYDRVADQSLEGISLNLRAQPTLLDAAARGEQTILFPEYHEAELDDLFRRLNINRGGKVYVQPLSLHGETLSVLLVSLPYRQADLSLQEIETLRDLGGAAAHVLAWSAAMAASSSQERAERVDEIADRPADSAMDADELRANRLELESSLKPVVERRAELMSQIVELQQQLALQQVRLLDGFDAEGNGVGAAQRLTAAFDEQARLRDDCEGSAQDLLEAETILRALNIGTGESLAQVIREYLHKAQNLLESARDRLRRQLNAALIMGDAAGTDGGAALLQSLADETAQLELEREQQGRRLETINERLATLGFSAEHSHTTQLLIQICAERQTLGLQLAEANRDREALVEERGRLQAASGGDKEALERQLKQLSADHEALLESREELRRDQQRAQEQAEGKAAEIAQLRAENEGLNAQISASSQSEDLVNRQIADLTEERDNLLALRDQLTAKVNAAMAEGGASAAVGDEVAELRSRVSRLSEQREELALALSDARAELETAGDGQIEPAGAAAAPSGTTRWRTDMLSGFIEDLRSPLRSLSDYAGLLLAESLGILGAAQQQVLRLMADDLAKLAQIIEALQQAEELDPARNWSDGYVDVMNLIDDVLRASAERTREKEIQIELSLADHLPPVGVDAASLRRVVARLVENAIEVSPPGAQVMISASAGSLRLPDAPEPVASLEIAVRDRGGGIDEADLPRIFARKYSSAYPKIRGLSDSGVGMSIARAFVRAHDGDMWVTSDGEAGAVFHLALPMQMAPSIEE